MPSKLQTYMQMADEAQRQLTGSYRGWTGFLTTAARLSPWMGAWPTAPRFAPGSPCGGKSGSICGKSGGDVWKIRPRKTR